uniref:Major facilitator superfamily MFS-1 domain containing protein n=2 Tax=Haemonchus contortus TaxID=6289 RepID=A0A7I4YDA6_HAECO
MKKKSLNVQRIGCLTTRTRYLVLFLGSACIASIASNMIVLNFTLICMGTEYNETNPMSAENRGPYDYTQSEKSYLMWAVAIGTLLAAWPFHWFYENYGARSVFFAAGMISTVATAAMPLAATYSWPAFLMARFFQGVSFGADFAAIGLIVVHWASLKQHGFFIALLSSFSQLSVMFTMPVAGELCESSLGWPSVYYVHSALSGILFTIWYYFYRDDPSEHASMTEIELEKINRGKGEIKLKEPAPIKEIMTNPVMWAVWLSAFGELMMSQFIVMYAPTYLKEVLGFRVAHTGYFVAVPRALHLAFKIISGIASDRILFLTEKTKMRLFNTIALMVSGTFFCVLGFLPRELSSYALVTLLIIECSTGFICGGFYKCATLVARQHSHFVLSQIQFIKCLSLFIEPLLVFLICTHNTLAEWRVVFLIHGVLLIAGNIIFCYFATDKPAAFTHVASTEELAVVPPEQQSMIGASLDNE